MTDSARNPGTPDDPADTGTVRNAGRRRLLKSGIATAPVVLTLTSRSVLGFTCRSPSAVGSGNVSSPGQDFTIQGTLTIAQWSNPSQPYPSIYTKNGSNATTFIQVFGSGSSNPLKDVLATGTDFEKHMVAAALNIANAPAVAQCLTLAKLQEMWAGRNGTYSPVPGVIWTQAQIVAYLEGNMIVPAEALAQPGRNNAG